MIRQNDCTPETWRKIRIKVISIKGNEEDAGNYRPICTSPALYKLFTTVLYIRLHPRLDQGQPADQGGFRRSHQTVDHVAAYRTLEQRCREWRINMWVATISTRSCRYMFSAPHRTLHIWLKSLSGSTCLCCVPLKRNFIISSNGFAWCLPGCTDQEPFLTLEAQLRRSADCLANWLTTHHTQVMGSSRQIPKPALMSAMSTHRSRLLQDEKMSTLTMMGKIAVSEDMEHVPQPAVGSRCLVASTVSALMILVSMSSIGKPVRSNESVVSVERNMSGAQVDRIPTSANRPGVRKYFERIAEIAIQGESEGRRRLSDADAHLESREWEEREKPEFALYETHQQLESQKKELLQASQWADQAQRERMNLCGETEMRNRLRHESQLKTNHQIEELRKFGHEEAKKIRRLQREDSSVANSRIRRSSESTSSQPQFMSPTW